MADLSVNYAALDQAQTTLFRVAAELEHANATRDDLAEIWGPGVEDAMRGFVDNWDRHRGELLASVRSVGEMCGATCDTFRSVERALDATLTGGSPGSGTASGIASGPGGGPTR